MRQDLIGCLRCLHQNLMILINITYLERKKTALSQSEKISRTAKFQILLSDLKSVVAGPDHIEALLHSRIFTPRQKDAVRLIGASAYATAKLMKLRKAESVCILYQHNSRIGNTDPHLDNSCGNKHIDLTCGKIGKNTILFFTVHSSVQHLNTYRRT